MAELPELPELPALPGKYRWDKTRTGGARIFEDLRARKAGGTRRNIGHFSRAVLLHVLTGQPLEGGKGQRQARALQRLLKKWKILA